MSQVTTSSFQNSTVPPAIYGGEGTYVVDISGACYIDCTGAAPAGHNHPTVVAAPMSTSPAHLSARSLAHLNLPTGWRHLLFDSGDHAIDAAATMTARATGCGEIVLLTTGPQGHLHVALSTTGLPDFRTSPTPVECVHHVRFGDAAALSDLLRRRAGYVAAVIAEPIATADVTVPTSNYWQLVRQMTEDQDVLLVFDESNTGFCRTGRWFAGEQWPVTPDAIVLGSALANGLPIGVLLCSERFSQDCAGEAPNSAALAAAEAMIALVSEPAFVSRVQEVGRRLLATLQRLADRRPNVSRARGAGLLLAVDAPRHEYLLDALRDHGLLATMTGDTLVIRPPLTLNDAEAAQIADALYACL